mmetsp:Transcript_22700/g.60509  ORF Transcript_22700/g.60509 Transcript_22700/m.60509 type:complete len:230 (+) Transcript_22700:115-804(+)
MIHENAVRQHMRCTAPSGQRLTVSNDENTPPCGQAAPAALSRSSARGRRRRRRVLPGSGGTERHADVPLRLLVQQALRRASAPRRLCADVALRDWAQVLPELGRQLVPRGAGERVRGTLRAGAEAAQRGGPEHVRRLQRESVRAQQRLALRDTLRRRQRARRVPQRADMRIVAVQSPRVSDGAKLEAFSFTVIILKDGPPPHGREVLPGPRQRRGRGGAPRRRGRPALP